MNEVGFCPVGFCPVGFCPVGFCQCGVLSCGVLSVHRVLVLLLFGLLVEPVTGSCHLPWAPTGP